MASALKYPASADVVSASFPTFAMIPTCLFGELEGSLAPLERDSHDGVRRALPDRLLGVNSGGVGVTNDVQLRFDNVTLTVE